MHIHRHPIGAIQPRVPPQHLTAAVSLFTRSNPSTINDPELLSQFLMTLYSLADSHDPEKMKCAVRIQEARAKGDYHELHRLRNQIDRSIGLSELLENPINAAKITDNRQVTSGCVVVASGALDAPNKEGHGHLQFIAKIIHNPNDGSCAAFHVVRYELDFGGYPGVTTSDSRTIIERRLRMNFKPGKNKHSAAYVAMQTVENSNSSELFHGTFIGLYVLHGVNRADLEHGFRVAQQLAIKNSELRRANFNVNEADRTNYSEVVYADYSYNCNNTVVDTVRHALAARDKKLKQAKL